MKKKLPPQHNNSDGDTNPVEFVGFLSGKHIVSLASSINIQPLIANFFSKILDNLGKILGFQLGFKIPSALTGQNVELWRAMMVIAAMRKLDLIEDLPVYSSKYYCDEPLLSMYGIENKHKDVMKNRSGGNGHGSSFFSKKDALWASIGEALERYALNNYVPAKYRDASFEKIKRPLNIFSLAGIAPEFRKKKHSEFQLTFDKNTLFRWVEGVSLTKNEKLSIPLQLCVFRRHSAFEEPMLRPLVSTGAATHQTLEEALVRGIFELIERDAFMITWINQLKPSHINLNSFSDERIERILEAFERYHLKFHAIYLPTDFSVHAVLGVIIDDTGIGPAVCVGASVNTDIKKSIITAATETLSSRQSIRSALDQKIAKGQDISYTDTSKLGRIERLLYWSNINMIKEINFLLDGKSVSTDDLPIYNTPISPKRQLGQLVEQFREKNLELAYIDILEPKIKKETGLHSVMTVAPELQPLHLYEGLPFTWGERLQSVPKKLGLKIRKKAALTPHPFP